MAKGRKKHAPENQAPESASDRHKPSKILRVPMSLANALDELANENDGSNFTQEGLRAIREYLRSINRYPKKP